MKNILLKSLLLIGIVVPDFASASYVSPEQALNRLKTSSVSNARMAAQKDFKLIQTLGGLYIFGASGGFMIMPDDDAAPALLGYSDSDNFSLQGNSAFAAWLEFYNKQLESLKSKQTNGVAKTYKPRKARASIAPLLKTEWNQESPYNMLCPKVNGHDVVTGCVATAMAQFMKFYNYPPKGKGTHSYYWEVGNDTLSMDYDTVPFQWNLMTDTYDAKSSEDSKRAVAELMVACGISVDMHYDIGDSGAATARMGLSLINTFGYSPSLWMAHRDYYGYDEWIGMIYDELEAGRPVLYSGQGTAGGHQFICDGYEGDGYFHFNWGWGGLSNGYFLLTALNPADLGVGGGAGGFNTDQIATLSAKPAEAGDRPTYIVYNSGGFVPDTTQIKAGENLTCGEIYFNFSMAELPQGSHLGMKFVNDDTKDVEFVKGPETAGIHLDEGRYYDIVKFPELTDGNYTITPALYADDKWWPVRMPLGLPDRITAIVRNQEATLNMPTDATIRITNIEMPDTIYAGHDCPLHFTAANISGLEYYGSVTPYLLNADSLEVASSVYRPVDVMPSKSENVNDYVANFTAIEGQTFDAGTYSLVFRDASGANISQPLEVYVDTTDVATMIKISDFKLVSETPVKEPDDVKFSFTLSCEEGVYYGCPSILIFPGEGGYEQESIKGDDRYLIGGESAMITVDGNLDKLKDGNYMAAVYYNGESQTRFVHFEIKRVETGVEEIEALINKGESIYTINGTRCTTPIKPGIYIISGKTVILR